LAELPECGQCASDLAELPVCGEASQEIVRIACYASDLAGASDLAELFVPVIWQNCLLMWGFCRIVSCMWRSAPVIWQNCLLCQ
jgi:hypothetical protein